MAIHWYPGHMHKAIKDIKELLPNIDIIIEVLDARAPYSSENPVIQTLAADKPCIKLLNKSDLADPVITQQWIAHFEQSSQIKALAMNAQQADRIDTIFQLIEKLKPDSPKHNHETNILILGVPNVGKSTLINHLAGRSIAKTGNEPAITKGLQKIKCPNHIMLHDSPGILWPKNDKDTENGRYRLAISGAIKDTAISYDDIAYYAVEYLSKAYPDLLKQRYNLESLPSSPVEFMEITGKQRGCLGAGGRVDFDKISKLLLRELRDGSIGQITLETPLMATEEDQLVQQLQAQKEADKAAKKQSRKRVHKKNKEA